MAQANNTLIDQIVAQTRLNMEQISMMSQAIKQLQAQVAELSKSVSVPPSASPMQLHLTGQAQATTPVPFAF
jgi:hypothetical protein